MAMTQIYLRIITQSFDLNSEDRIKDSIFHLLQNTGIEHLTFISYAPYWKNPDQGELTAQCTTTVSLLSVQELFADTWRGETADIRWSNIHIPDVCFLWISE